jgi:transposase
LDSEIAEVERVIALAALDWPDVRRLMTVPGVNVIVAATFLAAVGDIRRFASSRQLVGYLGLDPKVRQSGTGPASHGRISKQAPARPVTRWSKRAGALCAPPGRCVRSTSASAPGAATRSRSSLRRESWRVCSGAC